MATSTSSPSSEESDVVTVERFIAAPAAAIFALLASPARHREIDGSGTVRDASEPDVELRLGVSFGMKMKAGLPYSMVSTVIEYEQDRRIAWQTTTPMPLLRSFVGGRIWRYVLEPMEGGTLVRESWDIRQEKTKLLVAPLRSRTRDAMASTLARIEEIVTA